MNGIVNNIKEHYTVFVNSIESEFENEQENDDSNIDEFHELLNEMVDYWEAFNFLEEYKNEFKVLGKGAYGFIITCKKYNNTVFKWYFEGFDTSLLKDVPYDYVHLGYSYKKIINDNNLCMNPNTNIITVINDSAVGVIMEYKDVMTLEYAYENKLPNLSSLVTGYLQFYIDLLKQGYYLIDLTLSNMTFADGEPILIDLDLFGYSKTLKEIFINHKNSVDILFTNLKDFGAFKYTSVFKDELMNLLTKEVTINHITGNNRISPNPLE